MGRDELRELIEDFMTQLAGVLAELKVEEQKPAEDGLLSLKTLVELASHEGIVLEAYKDSKGIWTWGIGVTSRSGHHVERYKDNPQTLDKVFDIYEWLLRTKYLPEVLKTFNGYELSESQLAAALSFHYNTGAIGSATWVKSWKAGSVAQAKREFMNWKSPKEIIPRREKERDLFFEGKWSNKDGKVTVYTEVNKPSYTPKWSSAKQIIYKGK